MEHLNFTSELHVGVVDDHVGRPQVAQEVPVGAFQRVDEYLRTRQYLDLVGVEDEVVRPQRIPNISFGGCESLSQLLLFAC